MILQLFDPSLAEGNIADEAREPSCAEKDSGALAVRTAVFSFASLTDNAQDDTTAVDSTSDRLTTNYSNRHRLNGVTSDNEVTEADAAAVPGDEDDSNARPAPQNGLSRRP